MNVSDKWMLEQMQQMAASMTASLPQTAQNSEPAKTEKGETFQDMMNKAKDQKVDAPKKEDSAPVKKAESVQSEEPVQKTGGKVVTNMKDPRIRAMAPETQAQIAAGFLTPVETESGELFLMTNSVPSVVITPLLPNGQPDPSKPITLVNSNGEKFEIYLDQENGDHKLFQVMDGGGKKQIDLFPEQPKLDILDDPKNLDRTVITPEGKATTLREVISRFRKDTGDQEDTSLDAQSAEISQPLFRDVKAAPVKVGENFELDTQEPDMEEQLAETIRYAAQEGLKQLEIKLSPENLGNLTIKLTQASDGTLQVILHTTTAKAENLLNQHLNNLSAALQGYGQSEVRVEVQRNDNSQQTDQQEQQQTDPNGHNRQQQEQQRQQESERTGDFVQKLRLGLFGLEESI